jgi:hypothetical protein
VNPLKRGRIRLALAALGAVIGLAVIAGSAGATQLDTHDVTANATLAAGTLSLVPPTSINWTGVTVGAYGSDSTDLFQVKNPGSTSGWSVTAASSGLPCDTGSTPACTGSTIPASALVVNGVGSTSPTQTGTHPTGTCTSPCVASADTTPYVSLPQALSSSPALVMSADANTGVGDITGNLIWWLSPPDGIPAGTYQGTITLALNSGPNATS